ncbi:MAG: hypothetical protein J6583_09765, partial [Gilliamella sp.]|nr:hypothetical protein [Gilliamella sp.]
LSPATLLKKVSLGSTQAQEMPFFAYNRISVCDRLTNSTLELKSTRQKGNALFSDELLFHYETFSISMSCM